MKILDYEKYSVYRSLSFYFSNVGGDGVLYGKGVE